MTRLRSHSHDFSFMTFDMVQDFTGTTKKFEFFLFDHRNNIFVLKHSRNYKMAHGFIPLSL